MFNKYFDTFLIWEKDYGINESRLWNELVLAVTHSPELDRSVISVQFLVMILARPYFILNPLGLRVSSHQRAAN